jgi:hypothetical protein
MKARGAAIQGGLALAGLVAAYATWQRPREAARAEAVELLSATRQSLEQVRFDDGTRFVVVARQGGASSRLLTTRGFLPGRRPVVDAGVTLSDGGLPPEPPPTRETFASDRAEGLFARFSPLEATRALGVLPADKLDELGLVGSARHLEVTVAGQPHRYLASTPQPGLLGTYLQDLTSQQVYLAPSGLLTELDPASEVLVDRRLHTFRLPEVDGLVLTAEGKTAALVQSNAEVPATARLARAATPDRPDELARVWHDKVWSRLVVTQVLGRGERPGAGEPKVGLRVDYTQRGSARGFLELGVDPAGGTWARSENTAGWVGVHQGSDELIGEGRKLLPP